MSNYFTYYKALTYLPRNTEILKSAHKYGKNVKTIAMTGSINAITTGEDVKTRVYTSDSWLPVSLPTYDASKPHTNKSPAYNRRRSKSATPLHLLLCRQKRS